MTSPFEVRWPRGAVTVLEVVDPGPLATVQDLGRPGLARLGVSPSGAADRRPYVTDHR